MDKDFAIPQQTRAWLTDGVFKSSYQAYSNYLIGRGYSAWSVRKYLCSVAHFAHWLRKRRVKLSQIDEALVRRLYLQRYRRRTKATLIYKRTKNLRAVQLLLGHSKVESTIRYLGIEVDDALEISEQTEI